MFGNERFVWNQLLWMLEERYQNQKDELDAFKEQCELNPKLKRPAWLWQLDEYELNRLLPRLKEEYPFLKDSDSSSLQITTHKLKKAYNNFFDVTSDKGHPQYKKRSWEASYTGKSTRIRVLKKRYMKLPKLGVMKTSKTGMIVGKIKQYTVSRDAADRYWLSLQVDVPQPTPFPKTNKAVGIDLGLTDLAILSNGAKIKPFDVQASESQARIWQRKFDRRKHQASVQVKMDLHKKVLLPRELSDFKNWQRARVQKARYQAKTAAIRKDYLHKLTTQLVKEYDAIVLEDLKPSNMMKNHHLTWSIANASWATFKTLLQYKCEWYGKELVLVPPHYTSRVCHVCQQDSGEKPLHIREWTCTSCGTHHDRDVNAARNILYKGLTKINQLDQYSY